MIFSIEIRKLNIKNHPQKQSIQNNILQHLLFY